MTSARRAEQRRQATARWRARNPEKSRASSRESVRKWREENRHKDRENVRRWRENNLEKSRTNTAEWVKANPAKVNAQSALRRARLRGATVPLTESEKRLVEALYEKAKALTQLIGEPYHVDHKTPISRGGKHHPANLQVLRGVDNLRKGVKSW